MSDQEFIQRGHDLLAASMREAKKLREALEKYTSCHHGSIDCFCVLDARAALYEPRAKA